MALVLIRMKLAILRHSAKGERLTWEITFAMLALALAGATLAAAVLWPEQLPTLLAVWVLGWIFGPLFSGGGDESLRPEYFSMLPEPSRRIAAGLLVAAFAGIAPAISLIAFVALIVYGAGLGPWPALIAVPATMLTLLTAVLFSRLAVALFGLLLRSWTGAVLAGFVTAAVIALASQGWWLVVALGMADDRTFMETVLLALPSGWGIVVIEAVDRSDWLVSVAMLLLWCVLLAGALLWWTALISRRITNPQGSAQLPHSGRRLPLPAAEGRRGAVVAKELRAWSRDPMRINLMSFSFFYGLLFCLIPLTAGWTGMVSWIGVAAVLMAASSSANLYGVDGTALWLTLMTPDAERDDVRGRQLAWLLAVAPVAILISIVATALSGQGAVWPWVLALLPAVLGGAVGLVVLLSVVGLIPGTDPQKRGGNPLSFGDNDGEQMGYAMLMLILVPLTALPAGGVVLAGTVWDQPLLTWAGIPAGLLSGAFFAWLLGGIAYRRLRARGPEMLALMRSGTAPAKAAGVGDMQLPAMPRRMAILVYICWSLFWLPLFPQGLVPLIVKLIGTPIHSWFLALYLPSVWQWPVIIGMIALGLAMVAIPIAIQRRYERAQAA
ncbi:MAG: hypothetical protein AB7R89_10680 [Dehalococcoidia bacterium]